MLLYLVYIYNIYYLCCMKKSDIFKKAWGIAIIAAFNHGGNKSDYFAEALKEAHKMAKTHCKIRKYNWRKNRFNE